MLKSSIYFLKMWLLWRGKKVPWTAMIRTCSLQTCGLRFESGVRGRECYPVYPASPSAPLFLCRKCKEKRECESEWRSCFPKSSLLLRCIRAFNVWCRASRNNPYGGISRVLPAVRPPPSLHRYSYWRWVLAYVTYITKAGIKNQNLILFIRGKAMSLAPNIKGVAYNKGRKFSQLLAPV